MGAARSALEERDRSNMNEFFQRLIGHLRWADEGVLGSLRRAKAPPGKALEIYAHILGAEHVWLARLRQARPRHPVWPALTLDECSALADQTQRGLVEFLSSLAPADFAREITYTNSAGASFRSRIDDVLTQVVTHGCYHRGQVALLVRESGDEPQPTDYIAFVRGAPAATASGTSLTRPARPSASPARASPAPADRPPGCPRSPLRSALRCRRRYLHHARPCS